MEFIISDGKNLMCKYDFNENSKDACEILSKYLLEITGISTSKKTHVIKFVEDEKYLKNGFSYEIYNNELVFTAKNKDAFIYAVYDFLERVIGCRYFSSKVEFIPNIKNLRVAFEKYEFIPNINYREIYYQDYEDSAFAKKHKLAQSKVHSGWGFWCHSFGELLPTEKYFDEHPEYFALHKDERNPKGEPCLSNPIVQKLMIENLRKFIKEKPECHYWSVSQNDDNMFCTCADCKALDEYDESQMGSVLKFVNIVAKEFPDKTISTLAYWYTRKPPKHTRPEKNVHIMVCNIEAGRGLAIEIDPKCKESKEEMEVWASVAKNLSLWDYNVQFRNLVSPFPNLRTLQPNMQFFVKNNLKSLFSQCNREIGGEFCELRGYLLAKLAWDKDCDINKHMIEFCEGYYKEAGKYILEYINLMHDAQEKHNKRLDIFEGPVDAKDTYLTEELYNNYVEIFSKARKSVKDDILLRVEVASLPIDYAGIVLNYGKNKIERLVHFAKFARASNLKMVEEWKITVDQFVTDELTKL